MCGMTRRQVLASVAGVGVGAMLPGLGMWGQATQPREVGPDAGEATGGKRGPNVLMIAVDDLRPQLGCYGHAMMRSPHIDALAQGGTRFDRAYCQVAVCGASRASLLTGMRPTRERFLQFNTWAEKDAPDAMPMHGAFARAGYETLSLGKVFHHKGDFAQHWTREPWLPEGAFPGYANQDGSGKQGPTEAGDVEEAAYPDARLAERAISEMRRLKDADRPFFLAAGFLKPHLAFACPKKYWDLYDPKDIDLADNPLAPKGAPAVAMHDWGELRAYAGIPKKGPLDDDMARTLIHGYYACVSFVDAQIGRVLGELDRLGIADDTIVVLWGDHGWHLGDHGLWCKHSNFETAVHVPLIVRTPRLEKSGASRTPIGRDVGQSSEALVEFVDLYPSLGALCGIEMPKEQLQGTSFVPLLQQPGRAWKKAAFSQYMRGQGVLGESMRTERYRLTRWSGRGGGVAGVELYDHEVDPGENTSIADTPEGRGVVKELTARLDAGPRAAAIPTLRRVF